MEIDIMLRSRFSILITGLVLVGCSSSVDPEDGQDNLLTWTEHYSGVGQVLYGVTYCDGTYYTVGHGGVYLTSPDASNWTSRDIGSETSFRDVSMDGPVNLIVGYGEILRSFDTLTWTSVWTSGRKVGSVIWNGSLYVAVGDNFEGLLWTSSNGSEWIEGDPGMTSWLDDVEWNGSRFVAVGQQGGIITSTDASSWEPVASGTTTYLRKVLWNGTRFIAVGEHGVIVTSQDGLNWTVQQSVTGKLLMALAWDGSLLIAGGQDGVVISSPDGFQWSVEEGVSGHIRDMIYAGGRFVAVGDYGAVYVAK